MGILEAHVSAQAKAPLWSYPNPQRHCLNGETNSKLVDGDNPPGIWWIKTLSDQKMEPQMVTSMV
jgi:hypothetical protein